MLAYEPTVRVGNRIEESRGRNGNSLQRTGSPSALNFVLLRFFFWQTICFLTGGTETKWEE